MSDQNGGSSDKGSEQKTETPASGQQGAPQGQDRSTITNLPDTLKGKSTEQIAEMYVNLEKKLGEQSHTVAESKKLLQQNEALLTVIAADEELFNTVKTKVEKYYSDPEGKQEKDKLKKGDEGADKSEVDPNVSDLRLHEENRILNDFATKYGYSNLDEAQRKDAYSRLTVALADLYDPSGRKNIKQILKEIPVSRLSRTLENAHFLANKDNLMNQAKDSGRLEKRSNESATIGSFPASSSQARESITLTDSERKVAQKMGISEEAYAKNKAKIHKESKEYES